MYSPLPIRPRLNGGIGFYAQPLLSERANAAISAQDILPLNLLGGVDDEVTRQFLNELASVGIKTASLWRDSDAGTMLRLQEYAAELERAGFLHTRTEDVAICSCGKSEVQEDLATTESLRTKHKTFVRTSEGVQCTLCGSACVKTALSSLYLRVPDGKRITFCTSAGFAEREMQSLIERFSSRELRISRARSTGLKFEALGSLWNIDPDIAWMLYLVDRSRRGLQVTTLITGTRTLKQSILAMMMCLPFGIQPPQRVHSVPYITFESAERKICLQDLLKAVDSRGARAVISLCFAARKKEMILPSRMIHTIGRSVGIALLKDFSLQGIDRLLVQNDHSVLLEMFAKCRHKRGEGLTEDERRYLSFLFQ